MGGNVVVLAPPAGLSKSLATMLLFVVTTTLHACPGLLCSNLQQKCAQNPASHAIYLDDRSCHYKLALAPDGIASEVVTVQ